MSEKDVDIDRMKKALREIAIAGPDKTKEELRKIAAEILADIEYTNIPG